MLDGKVALIPGGAGNVGEGLVRAFLRQGATVITTSRQPEKLDQLRGYLGDLASDRFVPLVGDLADFTSAEKLRDQILDKFQHLDAIVASLSGTWKDNLSLTLLEQTKSSSYTFLGGGAAENVVLFYSLVGIPAAGQLMLAKVIMAEMQDSPIRINEVVINSLVNLRHHWGV